MPNPFRKFLPKRRHVGEEESSGAETSRTPQPNLGRDSSPTQSASTNQVTREEVQPSAKEEDDPYGLKLLAGPSEEAAASNPAGFDLVAVHGIDGNTWETWRHPNGTLWLKDLLPKYFPAARVFSFGYQAAVAFTRGRGDLRSFARSLLEGLNSVRYNERLQQRPIVFICHSMGGLVIKQVLITATIDSRDYGAIRTGTKGVLFLSTPHQGSSSTTWPKLLSNIGNVALTYTKASNFLGSFRGDLLKLLEEKSPELNVLNVEFRNQHENIRLISFYETDTTPPFKHRVSLTLAPSAIPNLADTAAKVVDERTGVMGAAGETPVPLDGCDHHTVCRFPGETNAFRLVLAHLRRIIPEVRPLTNEEQAFLRTLVFEDMITREATIDPPVQKTCEWLFRTPEYKNWERTGHSDIKSHILWIKGKPGSGKSTLMKQAIKRSIGNCSRSDIVLQFYFYGRGKNPLQNSPSGFYRSLMYQLLSQKQDVPEILMERYSAKVNIPKWAWTNVELRAMVSECFADQKPDERVILFVDALDECDEDDARETISHLADITKQAHEKRMQLNICFASRHFPSMSIPHCLELKAEEHNSTDIQTYTSSKLQSLHPPFTDSKDLEKLETILDLKASNVFLWLTLVVPRVLAERQKGKSLPWLLSFIETVPDDIKALFATLFEGLTDPEQKKQTLSLFQLLLFSERTLSLRELRHALAFCADPPPRSLSSWSMSRDYLEDGEPFERALVDRSRGLAEVLSNSAGLIHASVQEFLVSDGGFQMLDTSLKDKPLGQSHLALLRCCLAVLASEEVQSAGTGDTRSSDESSEASNPITQCKNEFLKYAIYYFHRHLVISESQGCILYTIGTGRNITAVKKWVGLFIDEARKPALSDLAMAPDNAAALFIFCQLTLKTYVKILLGEGIDINERISGVGSLLLAACHHRVISPLSYSGITHELPIDADVVRMLIEHSKDAAKLVKSTDIWGSTPLHFAAREKSVELAKLLISYKADVDCVNDRGETPLYIACSLGHLSMVKLLLEQGASAILDTMPPSNTLTAAVVGGNMEVIDLILGLDPVLNLEDEASEYGSPLCACFFTLSLLTAKKLLLRGADPWSMSARRSAFEMAADTETQKTSFMLEEIVVFMAMKRLLTNNNVNRKDCRGNAIIHYAVEQGFGGLVLFLLCELQADPDILPGENSDDTLRGYSPLDLAALKSDVTMAHLLIMNGAKLGRSKLTFDPSYFIVEGEDPFPAAAGKRYFQNLKDGFTPEAAFDVALRGSEAPRPSHPSDSHEQQLHLETFEDHFGRAGFLQRILIHDVLQALLFADALDIYQKGDSAMLPRPYVLQIDRSGNLHAEIFSCSPGQTLAFDEHHLVWDVFEDTPEGQKSTFITIGGQQSAESLHGWQPQLLYEPPNLLNGTSEELRLRVDDWKELEIRNCGELLLYGVFQASSSRNILGWVQLEGFLFEKFLVLVKEKYERPILVTASGRRLTRCSLKGWIRTKECLTAVQTSLDECMLTLNLKSPGISKLYLQFEDKEKLQIWRRALQGDIIKTSGITELEEESEHIQDGLPTSWAVF